MPSHWSIGTHTPERMVLAAELIGAGRSVSFGDFELNTSSRGALVVSVITTETAIPSHVDAIKAEIAERVAALLRENPPLAQFDHLPRLYELVVDWGNGGTWLGYWSEAGFQRGKPDD